MKTIHTDISENGHTKADLPLKQALLEMVGCPDGISEGAPGFNIVCSAPRDRTR